MLHQVRTGETVGLVDDVDLWNENDSQDHSQNDEAVRRITQRVEIRQTWWTEDWRDEAACRPPEHLRRVHTDDPAAEAARWVELSAWVAEYFPSRQSTADDVARAKRTCARCPVQAECLDWALRAGEWHGVWGGKSADERRDLWRELEGRPMGARAKARAERKIQVAA